MTIQSFFPGDFFKCELKDDILLVKPVSGKKINIIEWGEKNQVLVAKAIDEYGAIVFSSFNLETKEDFYNAYTAITGNPPDLYKGDTPRKELMKNIYKSTAVANHHFVPLHQEVSAGSRKDMPKYISFFCLKAPKEGTGQTLVGSANKISEYIQAIMPKFWALLSTKNLTYKARYLPTNSWLTRWIRWFNPSFATIQQRFGTEDPKEVEKICEKEGFTCEWDSGWAVISKSGIPAVINANDKNLFCNQIHVDKLTPKLCGSLINYIFARILIFPTARFLQFDVQFDDGTPISNDDAQELLSILEQHQQRRDWQQGDLLILNNATMMHGKTPHEGEREILVAMSGTVLQ